MKTRRMIQVAILCLVVSLAYSRARTWTVKGPQPSADEVSEGQLGTGVPGAPPLFIRALHNQPWADFALVLVDMQNDFFDEGMRSRHPEFSEHVTELLAFCRSEGVEVVHLRTEYGAMHELPETLQVSVGRIPCLRGSIGAMPLNCARELLNEKIVYKVGFGGFAAPELKAYLDEKGRRHLLIAGLTTDLCVFATAVGAVENGFNVSIVEDCCLSSSDESHRFFIYRYRDFLFDTPSHHAISGHRKKWIKALRPRSD
jgi:nicotinamidase-related amidase